MTQHVPVIRAFSFFAESPGEYPIEFGDCATVFDVQLSALRFEGPPVELHLQDSVLRVYRGVPYVSVTSPLRWPRHARLVVPPDQTALLYVTYSDCT